MAEQLDVLFVVPGNLTQVYQALARDHAIEPPAKARLIAAYLMRRNRSVAMFDANVLGLSPERMAAEVLVADPRLVVVPVYGYNPSSSTHTMPAARAFAQAIKDVDPTIKILFTGTHPAALPEKTLREEPIDYVCDGEGPVTVYQLVETLRAGGSLKSVLSLWYREDGNILHAAPAPLIDLSEEPAMIAWPLMDPRKYYAHDWQTFYADYKDRTPYANPFSKEGCPFSCEFCNIQAPFRAGESLKQIGTKVAPNSYRALRPELFVKEVEYLVENYGVKYFKIPDEMYALTPAHVLANAKGVKELMDRLGVDLNFWCYARIDTCKPEFLDPMRAAGIRWIGLGIEAADSTVRSGQDKDFSEDRIYDVVNRVHAAGIEGGLNYIFGLPGDTTDSMAATYRLATELNSAFANFYCAQALPGSALYRRALSNGYPLPERKGGPGWIAHSQYAYESEPYYEGDALKPAEILHFRDEAHVAYYSRPEYREKLRNDPKFGATALKNVEDMLSRFPLERRLLEEAATLK